MDSFETRKVRRGASNRQQTSKNNGSHLATRSRMNRMIHHIDTESELDTPCKQIAQLRLNNQQQPKTTTIITTTTSTTTTNKAKAKSGKLLSTKSLTQLMPRNYFFSKRNSAGGRDEQNKNKYDKEKKLTTAKSYTNGSYDAPNDGSNDNNDSTEPPTVDRMGSASLIVEPFPRQSTSNALDYHEDMPTLTLSNISPIVGGGGSQNAMIRNVVASTPTLQIRHLKVTNGNDVIENEEASTKVDKKSTGNEPEKETKAKKYKPFKNTALVLRDVKNSIGLRMRAKQESRAFEKLTDELITPPTKLYSPFNIYSTPGSALREVKVKEPKSKRRLNLNKNNRLTPNDKKNDSGNYSLGEQNNDNPSSSPGAGAHKRSPKGRIALQHKRHLIQANKFAFDSPTGRLRETVKDVEQFQQCIEDISKAIRDRNQPTDLI